MALSHSEHDVFEIIWNENRCLEVRPTNTACGFSILKLLEMCRNHYDALNHANHEEENMNDHSVKVFQHSPFTWRYRCTAAISSKRHSCILANSHRKILNRVIIQGCLMCQSDAPDLECAADVMLPCGHFFRQLNRQDFDMHANLCGHGCKFDDCVQSTIFNLHHIMTTLKYNCDGLQRLKLRRKQLHDMIIKTCVYVRMHRDCFKHLILNKAFYMKFYDVNSPLNYVRTTKDPLGYLILLHDMIEEYKAQELAYHITIKNSKLHLITFWRVCKLDATHLDFHESPIGFARITHDRASDVHGVAYSAVEAGQFLVVVVNVLNQKMSCTVQKGIYYNYHRITLLNLEMAVSKQVFMVLMSKGYVVIDLVCNYLIMDAVDHTIALCHLLLDLHKKARKSLKPHNFDDLFDAFMESEMKCVVLTSDVKTSISYPTFTSSFRQTLKRRFEK